jgi:hypothetical protein
MLNGSSWGRHLTTHVGRHLQALNHAALHQVLLHDFVDIGLVDKGVPNGLGVDHHDRAARTAVEAASFVDAHLAGAQDACRFGLRFAVVKRLLRLVLGAAGLTVVALVEAKKDVALVIRVGHGVLINKDQ